MFLSGYRVDTPIATKADPNVKAVWPSHYYSCASYIMSHKGYVPLS